MSLFEDTFITILNMSLIASYAAIAVIIVRLLLKKAPKVFSYALWSVVLFRLFFPFSFSSAFSLLGLMQPVQAGTSSTQYIPQDIGVMAASTVDTGVDSVNAAFNASLPAATPFASANPMQAWITLGTLIWIIGVAILLIYAVTSYLRLKKQISMATLVADNIYETDLIRSPFVCGIVRPKIYLPLSITGHEREYILCHEQIHIKRFDYLIKPVAYLALVFHWFNPLMWLCFSLMTKDMEMSCDERVMQRRGSEEVTGYSSSLLTLATPKKTPSPSPLAFGEGNVTARIKNILNYKKPGFWVITASSFAVIILGVVLISNPIKGLSIYEHPETKSLFSSQDSLKFPAKVQLVDHLSGDEYILTDANEIAKVTAILEDMRIAKKEISKARAGKPDSRYSISYYDDLNDSVAEYRYAVHVAPVWIDNNVKPSFRYNLINQEDILKRLEEVFAGKDGKAVYDVDSLMKNKTQYIGDNSKVVALIDALPLPKGVKRDSVELSSSKAPYGVTINYSLEDDSAQISKEQFLRNSVLLLALINNAEEVTHMGYWNNKLLSSTFKFSYTRADAERIVGGNVRQFAENQESLAELIEIIQMIKDDNERDEQAVRTLVEGFEKRLQMVSLTAPSDVAAASIAENYRDYVTPELVQKWQAEPQSAPGRVVSSPWPDRIEILRTERGDTNHYTVYGEIIEVTSVELMSGGAAAKRPVTLTVQKVNDRWFISDLTMGEYVQHSPVVYENTSYGFKFYLPETWQGYTIVEEQWKGTNGTETIETGPQLLIRHPEWSDKDPRQDIPIMIFTIEQWNALQKGEIIVSAAPIGPRKLGGNSKYVFALPARYNFAFPTGFKEVEEILNGNPLWPK